MIRVTDFRQFGHADHGWLNARHHFSFADYYDPARMGFGSLRVWNDDHIAAGAGFPMHPHQDMEIITYIRRGAVTHEDDLGNRGRTVAGQVQVMSAGSGIRHSEYNLEDEDLDLFQIWIQTDTPSHSPRWDTRAIDPENAGEGFKTLVSGRHGHPHGDAMFIHQDAALLVGVMERGEEIEMPLHDGRRTYLVPARGDILINGVPVSERGSAEITDEKNLVIKALSAAEVVVLDIP